jgi:hypothetical protein
MSIGSRSQTPVHQSITVADLMKTHKLRGFGPQANYTDRATSACRQS